MRFSCDSCGAQYMISDDKVGPGGVKVRCKRCGHVVLVRAAGAAAPVVEPAPQAQPTPPPPSEGASRAAETGLDAELGLAFDNVFGGGSAATPAPEAAPEPPAPPAGTPPPEPAAPAGEVEWYVAIGDRQVGPLLAAGVRSRWEAGEVGPDTLVWRAGLADWAPLSSVADLAQLVAPLPRPAARTAPRAETAPAPEPSRTPAPEKAREAEPSWKPAAASALAKLASEEMASLARPEAPKAAAGGGSLVEKMQLPEGGVDPTGMLPLHLKGVDTTGETLLTGKKHESTEVRQLRKSTNRRLVVMVILIFAVFGGALAYVMYSMTAERKAAPVVAVTPPAPAPAPAAAPPPPAAAAPAPGTPAPGPAAPGTPAEAPTAAAAAPAPPAAAPPPAPPPSTPAPKEAKAAAPEKPVHAARPARETHRTARKARPAREPERRVAAAPARKPAGDPLLDVAGDDDLARDLGGGGKKRSVYVPPAPGSEVSERVSDPQIIEAIVGKKGSLQACVEQQKAAGGDARGPLMLRWTILPDGSVKDVRSLSQDLARQPIVPCITGVVKSTRFPRSRLGREVEAFPFKF